MTMHEQKHLELSQVTIDFPTDSGHFRALQDVNLKIDKGEFVSLIGHSGCGKSTVLNIVAGLHRATQGGVILNGREVVEPGETKSIAEVSPCRTGYGPIREPWGMALALGAGAGAVIYFATKDDDKPKSP